MIEEYQAGHPIQLVNNFHDLVSTAFHDHINAICWKRELIGDFKEIVKKISIQENIYELDKEELLALKLSKEGQLARTILINDLTLLEEYGAAPVLNIIKGYERDDDNPIFPTDVYSFHVDRSPIPTATFLCTYYGASSDILPNAQAIQKVLIPEILDTLKKLYKGPANELESFIKDHCYDLHYQAMPTAMPVNLGVGHLWRLAVDYPESKVLPCIHRAPKEIAGEHRLLLIC